LGVVLDLLVDVTPVGPLLLLFLKVGVVDGSVGKVGKVAAPVIIVLNVLVFDVDVDATNLD
jgi:hypothetical protein